MELLRQTSNIFTSCVCEKIYGWSDVMQNNGSESVLPVSWRHGAVTRPCDTDTGHKRSVKSHDRSAVSNTEISLQFLKLGQLALANYRLSDHHQRNRVEHANLRRYLCCTTHRGLWQKVNAAVPSHPVDKFGSSYFTKCTFNDSVKFCYCCTITCVLHWIVL